MLNQAVHQCQFRGIWAPSTKLFIVSNRILFGLQNQPSRYFSRAEASGQPRSNLQAASTSKLSASQSNLKHQLFVTWKAQHIPEVSSEPLQIGGSESSERNASTQSSPDLQSLGGFQSRDSVHGSYTTPKIQHFTKSSRLVQIGGNRLIRRDVLALNTTDLEIMSDPQSSDSAHDKYLQSWKMQQQRRQSRKLNTKCPCCSIVARRGGVVVRRIISRQKIANPKSYTWVDVTSQPGLPWRGPSIPMRYSSGRIRSFFRVGITREIPKEYEKAISFRRPRIRIETIHLRPSEKPFHIESTAERIAQDEADRQHTSRLDEYTQTWSMRYAVIADRKHSLDLWCGQGQKRDFINTIELDMDQASIAIIWLRLESKTRNKIWERYMLLALQLSPLRALKVLHVAILYSVPEIPAYVLGDCLKFLAGKYLEDVECPHPSKVRLIYTLVSDLAKNSRSHGGQTKVIPQQPVYWVLRHCDVGQAESLYQILCNENVLLYPNTLYHFLAKFIDIGKIPQALEVLRKISCFDANFDYVAGQSWFVHSGFQSGCVKLLRARIIGEDGSLLTTNLYKIQLYIFVEILRMGIRPVIAMYNAMILNAVEAREYQSAMRFYQSAVENGLTPDKTTYGTLLKGALDNLDWGVFHKVVQHAEVDGTLYRETRLICDVLYTALKLEASASHGFAFDRLLQIYEKYCDLTVLQDLGLCEAKIITPATSKSPVRPPSSRIVGVMLLAYIMQHRFSSDRIACLYDRYRHSVEQRRPEVVELAETDHIPNAFAWAFAKQARTQDCTTVVKDMLEMSAASHAASHTAAASINYFAPGPQTSKEIIFASPTVQTWSILLSAYVSSKQTRAAEKILAMMRDQRMEPNHVTWNILVRGYSSMQDIYTAIDVVKRMESKGFKMDRFTLRGLGRYHNQTRLLEILKDHFSDELEAEDQEQDAEAEAEDETRYKALQAPSEQGQYVDAEYEPEDDTRYRALRALSEQGQYVDAEYEPEDETRYKGFRIPEEVGL